MIVWQTLSYSRDNLLHQNPGDIIGAILAAILQHMAFLVIAAITGWSGLPAFVHTAQSPTPTAPPVVVPTTPPDVAPTPPPATH